MFDRNKDTFLYHQVTLCQYRQQIQMSLDDNNKWRVKNIGKPDHIIHK